MEQFTHIVGWITIVLICVAAAGIGIAATVAAIQALHDKLVREARQNAVTALGRSLMVDAYWFSEDPPTQALYAELARQIRDYGAVNVSNARDVWRRERLKSADKPMQDKKP